MAEQLLNRFILLNKAVRILILSDFFLNTAFGLLAPILAVFILENIKGGDVVVTGIAVGIYWVLKSLLQVPIGYWLDKSDGEKDDYWAMVCGTALMSLTPLGFIFASQPWHIYVLQAVQAVGMAFAVPAWGGTFTRHINKGYEAETWGFESSALGFGGGIASIIGGIIAKTFGFPALFVSMCVLSLVATSLLVLTKKYTIPEDGVVIFPKMK